MFLTSRLFPLKSTSWVGCRARERTSPSCLKLGRRKSNIEPSPCSIPRVRLPYLSFLGVMQHKLVCSSLTLSTNDWLRIQLFQLCSFQNTSTCFSAYCFSSPVLAKLVDLSPEQIPVSLLTKLRVSSSLWIPASIIVSFFVLISLAKDVHLLHLFKKEQTMPLLIYV